MVLHGRALTGVQDGQAREKSRSFHYCELPDGSIGEVFAEEMTPDNSVGRIFAWAVACQAEDGRLYDAAEIQMTGRTAITRHDYLCVVDRKVVKVYMGE